MDGGEKESGWSQDSLETGKGVVDVRGTNVKEAEGQKFQAGPTDFRRDGLTAYRKRILP